MSKMNCTSCGKDEDTDLVLGLSVLDKYYYCEFCTGADGSFEIMDECQSRIDKLEREAKNAKNRT